MSLSVDVAGGVEVDTIPMIRIESLQSSCLHSHLWGRA
jgi:hypothetical protein